MIPKLIWQTYKTKFPAPVSTKLIKTWIDKNPDYNWYYFDDEKCSQFIQDHFNDEFYKMYESLPIGVMKSDVWRVAVIYVYGGIYADTDTECIVPIDEWIGDNDLVVGIETPNGSINNYVFASIPKHPAILSVLTTFLKLYNSPSYLNKNSLTPVQDFGAGGWSLGILSHYGLDNSEAIGKEDDYYNTIPLVNQERTKFFSYDSHAFSATRTNNTLVYHHTASINWVGHFNYNSWRNDQKTIMKPIKFITTFSKNGYYVYGKSWIESFLKFTSKYDNITAEIYINDMNIDELPNYGPKVEIVDFDKKIPHHKSWISLFNSQSTHNTHNKNLSIKFSYKSFVMIDSLKKNNDYVVWLDADAIFINNNFDTFMNDALTDKFIACQREDGSEHIESGIVLFNAGHFDKEQFVAEFEQQYLNFENFNSFGQFFDGYVIYRTLTNSGISYHDLNAGYGILGIQSDPNNTFLNPLIGNRFRHNIGISGKKQYETWEKYAPNDPMFQLIHGINFKTAEERKQESINRINNKLKNIRK
jgi:hypothetical protein